jgi:predicted phage terminase large subunit-like protein
MTNLSDDILVRTKAPKTERIQEALENPNAVIRELNNRSLYHFLQHFFHLVSPHEFSPNWHIELLCRELEQLAERVGKREPREYDLIINVPPGSTKTITCSIMFPAWCWTRWYWMRFITASYSSTLALEPAEYCRDLIRSPEFQQLYPEIDIKEDKNVKSNYKIVKRCVSPTGRQMPVLIGGSRYSTSVGGTLTGFHGDILIVDDPLNPEQSASKVELKKANRWCSQTLSTRKTDKAITPTVLIMQRLHQDDPSGHMLAKLKINIRHICLPGEARNYRKQVKPAGLYKYYKNDLLDPKRMSWKVLEDMEADLGQYGYAGQIGQEPTPPGGGMFKVDHFSMVKSSDVTNIIHTIRYWDKAATKEDKAAFTCGVKMSRLPNNRLVIEDVKRGRWDTDERERIMLETAIADGKKVDIWIEQEPGSGGKDSAKGSKTNLMGFKAYSETATGDKADRADPFSVQVNNGNVSLIIADWNHDFIEEYRFFPFSTYKDQVDAGSGAFNKLVAKRVARRIT